MVREGPLLGVKDLWGGVLGAWGVDGCWTRMVLNHCRALARDLLGCCYCDCRIWKFPKIRGTLFWAPCNKDPTI